MKKAIIVTCIIIMVASLLCACKKEDATGYQTTVPSTTENSFLPPVTYGTDSNTQSAVVSQPADTTEGTAEITTAEGISTPIQTAPVIIATQAPAQTDTAQESTTQKVLQKTGEMAFSDSKDNKYIKAVVNNYSVDAGTLAAIYTVPDNDGNIVLQFDGSKDENGKPVRTEDTLVAIYSVKKDLTCKRASKDDSLNEYPAGERTVMFMYTKMYIMPEFAEELKG